MKLPLDCNSPSELCNFPLYLPGLSISVDWLTLEPWLSSIPPTPQPSVPCSPSILTIFNYASLFRSFAFFLFRLLLCFCCRSCCCCSYFCCRLPAPSMRKLLLIWTPRSVCTFALPRLQRSALTRPALSASPFLTLSQGWPSLGNFNCNFCFLLAQLATPSAAPVSLRFSGHVCNIFVEISLK